LNNRDFYGCRELRSCRHRRQGIESTRRGPIKRRPSPLLSAGGRIPGIADDPRLPIFDDEDGRMSVAGGLLTSGEKE